MYKCISCKKVVPKLGEKIRCPYCGQILQAIASEAYRIFVKVRPEVVKRVRAR